MAANKRISFSLVGTVLAWTFSNGKVAKIDAEELSADLQHRAMLHGVKQKCADSMAIEHKQADGSVRKPTDNEKFEAISTVISNLLAGQWSGAREATGGILYRAFEILKPGRFPTVAEFQSWLAEEAKERNLTIKQFAAKLETQPGKIKDAVDQIREEMAGDEEMDTEDLLENL
ncbi:MAG TPA: hypothetical protein VNS88_17845 [Nitrospiraceae bacterium]|nr:hypothetical protein [Nitrospiraceae bacterium]